MVRLCARAATIAALVALWLLAAALLWRTRVRVDLRLPRLDPHDYFGAAELGRTARYERFLNVAWLLATAAQLAALAVLVARGPRLARALPGGRIARGILVGILLVAVLWLMRLPFGLAAHWWRRRHGIARQDYLSWLVDPWPRLAGELLLACAAVAIVLVLACRLGPRWWIAGGPAFAALGAGFVLLQPLLLEPRLEPLRDRALAAEIRSLARRAGVGQPSVEVREARKRTAVVNAEVFGIGPTRRVILWDTLLDGRFGAGEIRLLAAHELAHVARGHVWKGLGWLGLVTLPAAFVLAQATRRRGGLADPGNVPLAALVLAVLQLALLPAANAISRRYEAEADWIALELTRDPAAARSLFERFAAVNLTQPRSPTWAYVVLDTHPTLMERLAMVEAWRRANPRAAASGSPLTHHPGSS